MALPNLRYDNGFSRSEYTLKDGRTITRIRDPFGQRISVLVSKSKSATRRKPRTHITLREYHVSAYGSFNVR